MVEKRTRFPEAAQEKLLKYISDMIDSQNFIDTGDAVRGEENKSGLSRLNSSYSANSRPIYMYYIPNQWKFNEDFAELCRFEIAALIEA